MTGDATGTNQWRQRWHLNMQHLGSGATADEILKWVSWLPCWPSCSFNGPRYTPLMNSTNHFVIKLLQNISCVSHQIISTSNWFHWKCWKSPAKTWLILYQSIALNFWYSTQLDRVKRSAASWRKPRELAPDRSFAAHLRPNPSADCVGCTRFLIKRFKSCRSVCQSTKFDENPITCCRLNEGISTSENWNWKKI